MAFSLREIGKKLQIPPPPQEEVTVESFATLRNARSEDLSFYTSKRYREDLYLPDLIELFFPRKEEKDGIHTTAIVHPSVRLGEGVSIGAYSIVEEGVTIGDGTWVGSQVYIGKEVQIGTNCKIYPGVKILSESVIGNRVVIHPNAVLGSDGFGFSFTGVSFRKIPQVGRVVVEDDVEIGAGTTIDRATLDETRIGKGTKLDNLIQVGHNVTIGSHCIFAAQTGIAGSTTIGEFCRIGGQVGIAGHLKIGKGVEIGAQSGIMRDIPDGSRMIGTPALPATKWFRIVALLEKLPELLRELTPKKK